MGTPNSGISGHIRGWDVGVRVEGRAESDQGGDSDVFQVFATGGSKGNGSEIFLGTVYLTKDGPTFMPEPYPCLADLTGDFLGS